MDIQWRQSGLKGGVALTKYVRGGAEKWSTYMYIISGWGRKSGVAHATAATASLAPLLVIISSLGMKKSLPKGMKRKFERYYQKLTTLAVAPVARAPPLFLPRP